MLGSTNSWIRIEFADW